MNFSYILEGDACYVSRDKVAAQQIEVTIKSATGAKSAAVRHVTLVFCSWAGVRHEDQAKATEPYCAKFSALADFALAR